MKSFLLAWKILSAIIYFCYFYVFVNLFKVKNCERSGEDAQVSTVNAIASAISNIIYSARESMHLCLTCPAIQLSIFSHVDNIARHESHLRRFDPLCG